MTISAYSTTAASNTTINSINIAEGCPPGNINDAIRNIMADIASGPFVTALGAVGAPAYSFTGDTNTGIWSPSADAIALSTGGSERWRVDSSGNLLLGVTSGTTHNVVKSVSAGAGVLFIGNATEGASFFGCDNGAYNSANAGQKIGRVVATGRSINAAGTVNASGADYAEYMKKSAACGAILAGQVCGVDANGELTDQFDLAHSFVIKSTDPAYVGGDKWGVGLEGDELEAARVQYDRIAFSGQVPVNFTSAAVGDYLVPIRAVDGSITVVATNNPSFEEYRLSVGKVWKILEDGRAWVAVRI